VRLRDRHIITRFLADQNGEVARLQFLLSHLLDYIFFLPPRCPPSKNPTRRSYCQKSYPNAPTDWCGEFKRHHPGKSAEPRITQKGLKPQRD
jgi:hypothetical protein